MVGRVCFKSVLFALLHETLPLEQTPDLPVRVVGQIDAFLFITLLIQNDEVRVVVIDPHHVEEHVVVELFFFLQEAAQVREPIQFSSTARFEPPVSDLILRPQVGTLSVFARPRRRTGLGLARVVVLRTSCGDDRHGGGQDHDGEELLSHVDL